MLACQFIAWMLASVKRFDAIVLHAWESVREAVELSFEGDSETDLG